MIVDMHIHTMISSTCSYIDPDECIQKALEEELDAIVITEHDTHEGGRVMKDMAQGSGLLVLAGMELMAREGHLLIFGYDQDIKGILPAEEIIATVTAAGGLVVPAHPWRSPFGWYSGAIDRPLEETEFARLFRVVEMFNGQSTPDENKKGQAYCETTGVFGIGGSDAHRLECVGCVVTEFEDEFDNERDMVEALLSGRYEARIVRTMDSFF